MLRAMVAGESAGESPGRLDEDRVLLEAGHAPGRPEVDHQRLAVERLERDGSSTAHGNEPERRRGPADQRRAHGVRIPSEIRDQDGEKRKSDGQARDEHLAIDARCAGGGSQGSGHQEDPPMATAALPEAGTAAVAPRRGVTRATSPPNAMMAVAIQIQETIGLIRTSRPTLAPSMLWIDRYRSSVSPVCTAGEPMGSRWLSYWLMRGNIVPRLRPFLLTSTRASTD